MLNARLQAGDWVIAKHAGSFLDGGVGARALGLGGAGTAAIFDVTALYWNPAGLARIESPEIHGMHSERFSGIVNWDFIGAAFPFRNGATLGLGFFRLGVDDIPLTVLRDPDRPLGEIFTDSNGYTVINDPKVSGFVHDNEMAFVLSFACMRPRKISVGGNIRVIRKSVSEYGAWGIGFDFGILAPVYRSLTIAAVLLDGTSTLIAWNGGRRELILPHLRFGISYPFTISQFSILPLCDLHLRFENRGRSAQLSWGRTSVDFNTGLEICYQNRVALRSGYDAGRFTAGAGLRISTFWLDYGYSRHPDLGNTNRISLTFQWNKKQMAL